MRAFILAMFFLFSITTAQAETPFTLTGIKKLSVLVEDYSGLHLDKKFLKRLHAMMTKSVKDAGITVEKYNSNVLGIMIKSQNFGKIKTITIDLILAGQVYREGEKELVFGLTYQQSDTIEIEDIETDIVDSLEFLLTEFSDQYIEDQKE